MIKLWHKCKQWAKRAMADNLAMWSTILQGRQKAMVLDFLSEQDI